MARAKRDTDKEKASREAARGFFKADPSKAANDVIAHLKSKNLWTPSGAKGSNIWANNQKRAALGTKAVVRKAKPNPINEAQLGREIAETLGGTEKAIKALEAVKKLGSVGDAIKAVQCWEAVSSKWHRPPPPQSRCWTH